MSIALSELIERLQEDVPADSGVPSADQYERAIKDAVRDFSRRAGQEKIWDLDVVANTATYDLPADFLSVIALQNFWSTDGVLNTPQGLIPIPSGFTERITTRNGQLTILPTPSYTLTRQLRYKAGWALTEGADEDYSTDDFYEDMGEEEAGIILLKARSLAQRKKDNASSGGGYRYQVGGVSVDTTQSSSAAQTPESLESDYLERVKVYVGNVFLFE